MARFVKNVREGEDRLERFTWYVKKKKKKNEYVNELFLLSNKSEGNNWFAPLSCRDLFSLTKLYFNRKLQTNELQRN